MFAYLVHVCVMRFLVWEELQVFIFPNQIRSGSPPSRQWDEQDITSLNFHKALFPCYSRSYGKRRWEKWRKTTLIFRAMGFSSQLVLVKPEHFRWRCAAMMSTSPEPSMVTKEDFCAPQTGSRGISCPPASTSLSGLDPHKVLYLNRTQLCREHTTLPWNPFFSPQEEELFSSLRV